MIVTRLALRNWRNFRDVDVPLQNRTYLIGPNASGKSNLLDVFRFLRDVCKADGGGLQAAVRMRGGIQKLRCLHARRPSDVRIDVTLADGPDDPASWRYVVAFNPEGKGAHRILVSEERMERDGVTLFSRPNEEDGADPTLLTQTYLENVHLNAPFREVATFFGSVNYLHLVPQLLKFGDQIGGRRLEADPFGQGFLERVAATSPRTRDAWLRRIQKALQAAVPQFQQLRFTKDEISGTPHLEMRYAHYRPHAGWQREDQFSDGTLRLLALLWSLMESNSMLLLEEPELSLNDGIVTQIPLMLDRVQRDSRRRRQVIISTHSEALLSNQGIDPLSVLRLVPQAEGSAVQRPTDAEVIALESGLSAAEVLLPQTRPADVKQLTLL